MATINWPLSKRATATCGNKTLPASGNSGNKATTSCRVSVAAVAVALLLNNTKDLMMACNDPPPPMQMPVVLIDYIWMLQLQFVAAQHRLVAAEQCKGLDAAVVFIDSMQWHHPSGWWPTNATDAIITLLSNATLQVSAAAPHRLVHCWAMWKIHC